MRNTGRRCRGHRRAVGAAVGAAGALEISFSWMSASVLLASLAFAFSPQPHICRAPATRPTVHVIAELEVRDELKARFARDEDDGPKTAFAPDAMPAAVKKPKPAAGSNEALLEEIRALQPKTLPPAPVKQQVDLNGISPWFLILGAASYGACSVLAYQFTLGATEMFNNAPANPDQFYVVERLSTVARYVVIAMGALGSTVTAIASVGQLLLCVQVVIGIASGELDPKAKRVDPYGGRKQGQLEKMLRLMLGDKAAGLGIEDR